MTPLAYFLIVLIPLSAFVTIAIALRPGRPSPGRAWSTAAIQARLGEMDAQAQTAAQTPGQTVDLANAKALLRERRGLETELLRRGHGR